MFETEKEAETENKEKKRDYFKKLIPKENNREISVLLVKDLNLYSSLVVLHVCSDHHHCCRC